MVKDKNVFQPKSIIISKIGWKCGPRFVTVSMELKGEFENDSRQSDEEKMLTKKMSKVSSPKQRVNPNIDNCETPGEHLKQYETPNLESLGSKAALCRETLEDHCKHKQCSWK